MDEELEIDFSTPEEMDTLDNNNNLDFDFSDLEITDNSWDQSSAEGEWSGTDQTNAEDEAWTKDEWTTWSEQGDSDIDKSLAEIDALLKDLDEWTEDTQDELDDVQKIIESLKSAEWTEEAVNKLTELQADNSAKAATIESLRTLVSKLSKEKQDISVKNAELELYWSIDDAQLVYLNWHIGKARWGDDKSKKRIVDILDSIRSELVGKTVDEEDQESLDDKISKFWSYNNSKSDPNTKTKWWLDSFSLEL